MAEASDVSTGHLSCIERGYVLMNVATLGRIAKGLGVGVVELLIGLDDLSQ